MKKFLKRAGLVLLAAFVVIQFFRPERNAGTSPGKDHIATVFPVPAETEKILKTACYDCHSANTYYPWYANVQPIGWWLNHHVEEGKAELDFDAFATYSLRRQYHKLEEVIEMVNEGEMPLSSYTIIHGDAELNDAQKKNLIAWAESVMDTMKAHYPMDSLVRPRR